MSGRFVGGYYDSRVSDNDCFEGMTPFRKDVGVYTIEEALKLPFLERIKEWFKDRFGKEWKLATEDEMIRAIEGFSVSEDIAALFYFDTEEKARKYQQEILKEIEEIERKN